MSEQVVEKFEGVLKSTNEVIKFKRVWGGHRFTDEECDAAYEAHIKALRMKDEFIKDYGSIRIKREFKPNGFMYNPINNLMTSLYDLFDL